MDIWERIEEDLKTTTNNKKQAELLKDKWGYQYWRGRFDALDGLLFSKEIAKLQEGKKIGEMRSQEEITKTLVELTSLHGYAVGSKMADEKETNYRKGVLAALKWALGLSDVLPANP